MKTHLKTRLTTLAACAVLAFAGAVNAATITYGSLETWNADSGGTAFSAGDTLTSTSNWTNIPGNNDVVINLSGTTTGFTVGDGNVARIRRANGGIEFVPVLTLVTDNAVSLTVELDYQARFLGSTLSFEYSKLGDFSDAVVFGDIDTTVNSGEFEDATFTATNGVGGIVFADTASIRLVASGDASGNPDGTVTDNLLVTAVTAPIPEPGSLALLAMGGLCILHRRRG